MHKINIDDFACDYCGNWDESAQAIEAHEKECTSNPVFKLCASCLHKGNVYYSPEYKCLAYKCLLTWQDRKERDGLGCLKECPKWESKIIKQ